MYRAHAINSATGTIVSGGDLHLFIMDKYIYKKSENTLNQNSLINQGKIISFNKLKLHSDLGMIQGRSANS